MLPLQPSVTMERHLSIHATGSKIHCVPTCVSCLKALDSCRLGTNLLCMFWVLQGCHVTALKLPRKGDFFDYFQVLSIFRMSPASQFRSTFVKSKDAVMPKSQSHIATIYWMLISINTNSPHPYVKTLKTMQKLCLRTAVKLVPLKKTQNVLFSHTDASVRLDKC